MTHFQLALYVHLVALFAAFGASTVVHLAMAKMRSAPTGRVALEWLGVAHAFARVFPLSLAALVGTGAWMVHDGASWSAGFVDAGLGGVAVLFVSGAAIESSRARRAAAALAARPDEAIAGAAAALVRDPVWWCVSWANTGIALGVVYAMVTRASAGPAFAAPAVGLCVGVVVGLYARSGAPARAARASDAQVYRASR